MSPLLALLLQVAAPAPEPAWQSLGTRQGIETAFDPASVRTGNGPVRVRIRGVTQSVGADGIRTVIGTLDIDCTAGTATSIEVKGYDAQGGLVLNAVVPVAERVAEPIRPDSSTAAVRARVCTGQGR